MVHPSYQASLNRSRDQITGLSRSVESASASTGQQTSCIIRDLVPVYVMVGEVANGLTASGGQCITPGGAFPQMPGLSPDTEVYQFQADVSNGIGYGPCNALVPIPPQPGLI